MRPNSSLVGSSRPGAAQTHCYSDFEYDRRQPSGRTRVATAAMIGSLISFSTISILSVAATVKRGPTAFSIAVRRRATKVSGPAEVEKATEWTGRFRSSISMMA